MKNTYTLAQKKPVLWLTMTAVLLAMNVALSSFSIPVPGGHLYLNDVVICMASILLDPFAAFVVGGIGAAFINAGILTLLCLFIVYKSGLDVDGHTVTSTFLMFGFSLFGKNLLNIWMILLGVWFYAKYHKTAPSRYIYIALYGTSLSPIITQMMQIETMPVRCIQYPFPSPSGPGRTHPSAHPSPGTHPSSVTT